MSALAALIERHPELDPSKIPWRNRFTGKPHIISLGYDYALNPKERLWVCKGRGAIGIDSTPSMALREWENQELKC